MESSNERDEEMVVVVKDANTFQEEEDAQIRRLPEFPEVFFEP